LSSKPRFRIGVQPKMLDPDLDPDSESGSETLNSTVPEFTECSEAMLWMQTVLVQIWIRAANPYSRYWSLAISEIITAKAAQL
jgi:hypothetical protein